MSDRMARRGAARLDDKILAAFRQACREGELDVAEHLMRALETLAEPPDGTSSRPVEGACLNRAYLIVAEGFRTTIPKVRSGPKKSHIIDGH